MTTPPLLEVKDLRIGFQHPTGFEPVVRGINFSIAPKSTYALVGESGCGKTMTSLAIMGLLPPEALLFDGSEVNLQEKNLLTLPEVAMRNVRGVRIGMVFQEPMSALNPVLTVGEQIAEVLTIHRAARNKKSGSTRNPKLARSRWHSRSTTSD